MVYDNRPNKMVLQLWWYNCGYHVDGPKDLQRIIDAPGWRAVQASFYHMCRGSNFARSWVVLLGLLSYTIVLLYGCIVIYHWCIEIYHINTLSGI